MWPETHAQMCRGRPLFGMMVANDSGTETHDASVDSTLLRRVLRKEEGRRRQALPEPVAFQKSENLLFLATLVGGLLPRSSASFCLTKTEITGLLPDPALWDSRTYRELMGGDPTEATLPGLQPDILGERFVLDRLASDHQIIQSTRTLILAAWTLQPEDLCEFILRASADFPRDSGIDPLCDLPLDSPAARGRWGRLVGDLLRIANRSRDDRTQRLLNDLRRLADQYSGEVELQAERARTELYLGNIYLFAERDYERARAQFELALTLAPNETDIRAAAINNRGILYHMVQDEENAFTDWTHVINTQGNSDEAIACSLNNRADIYARRGAHQDAIRDRSRVLALKETSPDRRYIALIRRSRSYLQLRNVDTALQDLQSILDTDDIAPEQKAEARLMRANIFKEQGQLQNAQTDLEAVVASETLFAGTRADALMSLVSAGFPH